MIPLVFHKQSVAVQIYPVVAAGIRPLTEDSFVSENIPSHPAALTIFFIDVISGYDMIGHAEIIRFHPDRHRE